jgi:hypothetical protein
MVLKHNKSLKGKIRDGGRRVFFTKKTKTLLIKIEINAIFYVVVFNIVT